jgi:hypothetical protein
MEKQRNNKEIRLKSKNIRSGNKSIKNKGIITILKN